MCSKEAADVGAAMTTLPLSWRPSKRAARSSPILGSFCGYLLSSNIGEVMTMFFDVLLADAIGLTAAR